MFRFMGIVSVIGSILAISAFLYVLLATEDVVLARSVVFMLVGVISFAYVFSVGTLRHPFWKERIFANGWLYVAVLAGLAGQTFPFVSHSARQLFGILPPNGFWLVPGVAAVIMFLAVEAAKFTIYKRAGR